MKRSCHGDGKEDVKLISKMDLDKIGLEIEEPKRLSLSIMIYPTNENELKWIEMNSFVSNPDSELLNQFLPN